MKNRKIVALFTGLLVMALGTGVASASTKYLNNIPAGQAKSCTLCHTNIPALNATGVKFVQSGHSLAFLASKPAPKPAAKPVVKKPVVKKTVAKKPVTKTVKPAVKTAPKPAAKLAAKPAAKPVVVDKAAVAYSQWAKSGHAEVIVEADTPANDQPNMRGMCTKCHTTEGFVKYTTDVKKAGGFDKTWTNTVDGKPVQASMTISDAGKYAKPAAIANCDACHNGKALRVTGLVGLQTTASAGKPGYDKPLMMVNAGKAAACFICHDYRKAPGKVDIANPGPFRAAHAASQTEMLLGFGGKEFPGQIYQSSPHSAIQDSCVTCHVTSGGGHSFKPTIAACQKCHPGLTTFNRLAGGDYDGDKKIEGIQDEVKGLTQVLQAKINEKLGYPNAYASTFGGSINIFEDKNHTSGTDPLTKSLSSKYADGEWEADATTPFWKNPDAEKIYFAYYNMFLVEEEGSWGLHNPVYAVQLLQSAYRNLTGTDIPNARIR